MSPPPVVQAVVDCEDTPMEAAAKVRYTPVEVSTSPPIKPARASLSRRAVLGVFAAMLWPTRHLSSQESALQMIPVEGDGANYWSMAIGTFARIAISSASGADNGHPPSAVMINRQSDRHFTEAA
jgi:hypothetical protein